MESSLKYAVGVGKNGGYYEYVPYYHITTCSGWTSSSQTINLSNTVNGYNDTNMQRLDYLLLNFYSLNYQYGTVLKAAGYPDWGFCSNSYRLACVK